MYQVDKKDRVVRLTDVPQSSIGAPHPVMLAEEGTAILAFYLENRDDGWNGTSVRMISSDSEEPMAIAKFRICSVHNLGPPNDEAFSGHPLASRGLDPYGAYEVLDSSWIRQLERMNSVHPYHKSERFWTIHHYIFSFHDSVFECVADGYEIKQTFGSMVTILPKMAEKLWSR